MTDEIINRVLSGRASAEEARAVANWFKQPEGSMELVQRIDHDLNKEWEKHCNQHPAISPLRHWLRRVACALLIVGCTLGGWTMYQHLKQPLPVPDQVVYTARGEHTQVVLQDGTRIYLNSESRLTVPTQFTSDERRIHLDGEAYFDVTKDAHRPFIVEVDNATVTVLGTQFNAKSYANEPIQVTLDEGSVRFSAPNIADVMLKPGEMVHYDKQLAKAEVRKVPVQTAGTWRNHRIDIDNMPLEEVITLLERNYNVNFNVKDPKCYNHSFTLSMDDYSLNQVLKRMDRLSPLSFKYDEQNNTVEVR